LPTRFTARFSARFTFFAEADRGVDQADVRERLREVAEKGTARDVHLYWGARKPIDVYEESLVLQWQREHPRLKFTVVLSEATAAEAVSSAAESTATAATAETSSAPASSMTTTALREADSGQRKSQKQNMKLAHKHLLYRHAEY